MRKPMTRAKRPPQAEPPPRRSEDEETAEDLRSLFSDVDNPKQVEFLLAYLSSKSLLRAQRRAGVHRHSHYYWMEHDPKYPEFFRRARRIIADEVEEEAYHRAFVGTDWPIYYHGRIIGSYKIYSDKLAIFMLKTFKPEIYGDKQGEEFSDAAPNFKVTIRHEGEDEPWEPDLSRFPRYDGS